MEQRMNSRDDGAGPAIGLLFAALALVLMLII
jgi:hypothetical protein